MALYKGSVKIAGIGVSDTAFGSSWDGKTGTAPSQNAVYDKISSMDTTISGKANSTHSHTISDVTDLESTLGSKIDNPSGGSVGQFLKKTATGTEWADAGESSQAVSFTKTDFSAGTAFDYVLPCGGYITYTFRATYYGYSYATCAIWLNGKQLDSLDSSGRNERSKTVEKFYVKGGTTVTLKWWRNNGDPTNATISFNFEAY